MRDEDGQVGGAEGKVGGDVHGHHSGQGARRAHVDRFDARVRKRRAHQAGLERVVTDVVGEVAAPAQQPVVFDALHPGAEPARRHPFESSAARRTARRIDA